MQGRYSTADADRPEQSTRVNAIMRSLVVTVGNGAKRSIHRL